MNDYYSWLPEYIFGQTILDIGANDGQSQIHSTYKRKFLEADYLGLDICHIKNRVLRIIKADILSWNTPIKYDTVLVIAVIEHIQFSNWEILFEKLKDLVKINGYLAILVPYNENFNKYLTSRDYRSYKNTYNCHNVFHITSSILKHFLPSSKIIKHRNLRWIWRENKSTLRNIARFWLLLFKYPKQTFSAFRTDSLIAIWQKKE